MANSLKHKGNWLMITIPDLNSIKSAKLESEPKLVIEHKDRLARFGVKYIELICHHIDCELIIINKQVNDKEDLVQDFVSVITSFCARIYGQRRNKRKTEQLIKELTHDQIEPKSKKT
jgi:putative resolvase